MTDVVPDHSDLPSNFQKKLDRYMDFFQQGEKFVTGQDEDFLNLAKGKDPNGVISHFPGWKRAHFENLRKEIARAKGKDIFMPADQKKAMRQYRKASKSEKSKLAAEKHKNLKNVDLDFLVPVGSILHSYEVFIQKMGLSVGEVSPKPYPGMEDDIGIRELLKDLRITKIHKIIDFSSEALVEDEKGLKYMISAALLSVPESNKAVRMARGFAKRIAQILQGKEE